MPSGFWKKVSCLIIAFAAVAAAAAWLGAPSQVHSEKGLRAHALHWECGPPPPCGNPNERADWRRPCLS